MRLLLVCSSGGHLAQLHVLDAWWRRHDRHWVCFEDAHAAGLLDGERVSWAHHPTTRHLGNLLRNARLAWRLLRAEPVDLVISTGAGVALPFFVLARLRGIPTAYLEVYDRIDTATLTGRLCAPFTDAFLLQWPEQQVVYPRGELLGPVY